MNIEKKEEFEGETYEDFVDYLKLSIQKYFRKIIWNHYRENAHMDVLSQFSEDAKQDGYPEEWIQKLEDEWDEIFDDAVEKMVTFNKK